MTRTKNLALVIAALAAGCAADRYAPVASMTAEPPSDAEPAALAREGWQKPQPKDGRCLVNAFSRADLFPRAGNSLLMKFAVMPGGTVTQFHIFVGAKIPARAFDILRSAVESCEWIPGRDPDGREAAIWVILPLRIVAH